MPRAAVLLSASLLSVAAGSCSGPQAGVGSSPAPLHVIAFGDSTTATRSNVTRVYTDRLPGLLADYGFDATVVNEGVGGSHTGRLVDNAFHPRRHALDRFDDVVCGKHADVVIIQFGWNDSWVDSGKTGDRSRIPRERYTDNLAFMIEALEKDGVIVILMTPNPPRLSVPDWQRERTARYAQIVRDLGRRFSVPVVDVWNAYLRIDSVPGQARDDLLVDALHPGDLGHKLVAELLAPVIAREARRHLDGDSGGSSTHDP